MTFAVESIFFTLLSALFFLIFLAVARRVLPVPPLILAAKEKESRRGYRTMRWEYISNYGSLIHAVATTALSLIALNLFYPPLEEPNTVFCNLIIAFSLGYFLVDTAGGLFLGYNDNLMHLHHFLALFMSYSLLSLGHHGAVYLYVLVIGELTNPFLIVRKNLEKHNAHKGWSISLGLIYAVSFLVLRGVVAQFYLPWLLAFPLGLPFKTSLAVLWYFSLYWCYTIVNFVVKGFRTELKWKFLDPLQNALNRVRASRALTVGLHIGLMWLSLGHLLLDFRAKILSGN